MAIPETIPSVFADPDGQWAQDYISGRQSFGEFRNQALNAQLELGNATQQLTQDSRAWDFEVSHPIFTGMVVVGPLAGAAAASGVQAYAAFHAATYPRRRRCLYRKTHPRRFCLLYPRH
jgi:hypothetical protein